MKRIWRFDFRISTNSLNKAYEGISVDDKEKLASADISSSFDIEIKNKCQSYIIASYDNVEIYREMFKKYNIKCKMVDITSDIMTGKFDIERDIVDFLCTDKSLNCSYFIDDVLQYIYDNLDMDIILDKISNVGISKLTVVEKRFLDDISTKI